MQRITCAGTAALAAAQVSRGAQRKTVTYRISGFTCITCAVGLETLLNQQKGILRVEASYPKANVMIDFDPTEISEKSLKGYISQMGFGVEVIGAK